MGRTVGIDLGTTNSAVAAMDPEGEPQLIVNAEGNRTTPSVVARALDGEHFVGAVAKRQAATNPENTLFSVKRLMGQRYNDEAVQAIAARLPYELVRHDNGDAWVQLGDETLAPPEVGAMVLQKLKTDAERYLGEEVTDAVITVPAYFDDGQRNATKAAGTIAGLNVIGIVNEPTAAALAYGIGAKASEESQEDTGSHCIAVFDLGGGTFDISLLRLGEGGVFDVMSTAGDAFLGGDDFDLRVAGRLLEAFGAETGIDLSEDQSALMRVKEAAEQAKAELSTIQRSRISLPYIAADATGPKHLEYELTRDEFEELVVDLVERTREPCRRAMEDAGLERDQIDQVILVGGQTRMPLVREIAREYFGREPHQGVNPDEVVALGAAVQAGSLSGEASKEILLLDVTSQTLGTSVIRNRFSPIIARNTTIPTSNTETYYTVKDNQTGMLLDVLQGESEVASENRKLGDFHLNGLRRKPAGQVSVDVTFSMDADGILSAHAVDHDTGVEAEITITDATGLTERQIEEMTEKAAERFESDAKQNS